MPGDIHTDIDYPLVSGGIPRLLDMMVTVFGDSEALATPDIVWAAVEDGLLRIYKGDAATPMLEGPVPSGGPLAADMAGDGARAVCRWRQGDPVEDTGRRQVEPCRVLWLSPHGRNIFKEALDQGTGLGFEAGEGLTVTGAPHRSLLGSPEMVERPAPVGMMTLNGRSARVVPIGASASVRIGQEEADGITTIRVELP